MKMKKLILTLASLATVSGCDLGSFEITADQWSPPPAAASKQAIAPRAPCSNHVEQRQALFGDLHIHTSLSMDANANGTRTSPDDAYRYARGEAIEIYSGDPGPLRFHITQSCWSSSCFLSEASVMICVLS